LSGKHSAGPRAKVFRRVVLSRNLVQVLIHIGRTDAVPLAVLIEVLKQVVTGEVAARFDRSRQAPIVELNVVFDTALPAE
jgi:uncharacterized linocin/CFP29 family protein